MTQYIDKDALVAEIERRIKGLEDSHADTVEGYAGEISGLKRLLSFLDKLDTLEVKDVDLKSVLISEIEKGCDGYLSSLLKHYITLTSLEVKEESKIGETQISIND